MFDTTNYIFIMYDSNVMISAHKSWYNGIL